MKKGRRTAAIFLTAAAGVWLMADAGSVRRAASEGLALCLRSVIPSLFPFLAVSSLLISLGFGELLAGPLAGWMGPLFRVDGAGSAALLLGLTGGYPVGARTAAELFRQGALGREEAERLLGFCNNSNPAFFLSILGAGVFGSVRTGLWLWLIHVASALVTGLVLCRMPLPGAERAARRPENRRLPAIRSVRFASVFVGAVRSALASMGGICAFVLLFYVLARPLTRLGGIWGTACVGFTELFSLTPLLTPDRAGFVLASALSGWGGLSVQFQTMAVLEGSGLSAAPHWMGKALQGLLSAALAAVLAAYVL